MTEAVEAGEREAVAQLTVVRIHLALHPQVKKEGESSSALIPRVYLALSNSLLRLGRERMGNPITTPFHREKYLSGRKKTLCMFRLLSQ